MNWADGSNTLRVLFENKFYRAVLTECPEPETARGTIVYFDALRPSDSTSGLRNNSEVLPDNFITRAGFRAVIVHPSRNDWYAHPTATNMARTIAKHIANRGPIVSYGTSMGGFGAIAHAKTLGANLFLAASPQASKSNAYMDQIRDRRWRDKPAHEFRRDLIREGAAQSQRGIVAFDPVQNLDLIHARTILRHSAGIGLECPATGHYSAVRLMREYGFRGLMHQIFDRMDDTESLRRWVVESEARFRTHLGPVFLAASDDERLSLLAEHGPDAILKNTPFDAIVQYFEQNSTDKMAQALCTFVPALKTDAHRNAVRKSLQAADLAHLLP